MRRVLFACVVFVAVNGVAETIAPPIPQQITVHSSVLNEDRVIWVRTPAGYPDGKIAYPVVYLTDGADQINELGAVIDFLVKSDRMPPAIVVGITSPDRVRDLTPTHWSPDPKVDMFPTSGGADRFLDFVQRELIPEIDARYHTAPYRVFAGHSLGGLLALHIMSSRPEMFAAYIAVSPSLHWDDDRIVLDVEQFLTAHRGLKRILFVSMANEGERNNILAAKFARLKQVLAKAGDLNHVAMFADEDHGSTVLRAHYAGLRVIYPDWEVKLDAKTPSLAGIGLGAVKQHYKNLSSRYGYDVAPPASIVNGLGYELIVAKRFDEAIAAFQFNVELHPESANPYDSLGDGLAAAGKLTLAIENVRKAVDLATKTGDVSLGVFERHLKRLEAEERAGRPAVAPPK